MAAVRSMDPAQHGQDQVQPAASPRATVSPSPWGSASPRLTSAIATLMSTPSRQVGPAAQHPALAATFPLRASEPQPASLDPGLTDGLVQARSSSMDGDAGSSVAAEEVQGRRPRTPAEEPSGSRSPQKSVPPGTPQREGSHLHEASESLVNSMQVRPCSRTPLLRACTVCLGRGAVPHDPRSAHLCEDACTRGSNRWSGARVSAARTSSSPSAARSSAQRWRRRRTR
jgi:hypothetical protein